MLAVVALAAVPAVTAADDGDNQDTVGICHYANGKYEQAQARETDFYGEGQQGHGTHPQDIVPPFVIEDPRPGDPSSFPGRNWDSEGQSILSNGCVTQPPVQKKVRICHRTSSTNNPYVSNEPAIADNGDLQGGHLNHTGPVFPEADWGDIIPPYTYVDKDGNTQTFPGYNWSAEGQAIYQSGCESAPPPDPESITPIVQCVEATSGGLLAHFGYDNPNSATVTPPAEQNVFSPPPENRGQPTAFGAGHHDDVFQADIGAGSLTWSLTGKTATASAASPRCPGGSITIVKRLVPADDPGRFSLQIDGEVAGGAAAVGNEGTTGTIDVPTGRHTVSESAVPPTKLGDYSTDVSCRNGSTGAVGTNGPSFQLTVQRGDAWVCTITNEAEALTDGVRPILECVVFGSGGPDVAVWGYDNPNDPVTIPVGAANGFTPTPKDRGQPDVFEKGRFTGVFQTPFEADGGTLTWELAGTKATASGDSRRCTATIELRKVVVPASDPGRFDLRLNGAVVASGGDGTTTGQLIVGAGEGRVSETAAAGTDLADYESSVECTRNGTVAISVPGTKVDGAVANGDDVVCTFTNHRKGTPPTPGPTPPNPPTPPTPPGPPTPPPLPPPGPEPLLDLAVTKTGVPSTVPIGGKITWTMTVANRSSVAAADVNGLKVDDPRSFRTKLISLKPSQGTCRPYVCDLGRLGPGASATVVAVSEATEVGVVANIVRVGSEEAESNYRNNVATALVRVVGPFRPPAGIATTCRTMTAAPRLLRVGRTSIVLVTTRNELGRPLPRLTVRARGAGVDQRARTDKRGIARLTLTPTRGGLILFAGGDRTTAASHRCRTLLGAVAAAAAEQPSLTG